MVVREYALQSNYEAKLEHVVYEYVLKTDEDKFSIQALSNELNAANNSKEEVCQRVAAVEFACTEKEFEVERLHREIVDSVAAFKKKVGAEVLAANIAFNEKLAMLALELGARFDRKLDVELAAEKIIAIEQHSAELEVLNYEH
jgi:uncharacterized membrane protein